MKKLIDGFYYGFFSAVIVVSVWLFTQYGDPFYYVKEGAFRFFLPFFDESISWYSVVLMSISMIMFYRYTCNLDILERLWYSMIGTLFVVFVYDLHHVFYLYSLYHEFMVNNTIRSISLFFVGLFYFKRFYQKIHLVFTGAFLISSVLCVIITSVQLVNFLPGTGLQTRFLIETSYFLPFFVLLYKPVKLWEVAQYFEGRWKNRLLLKLGDIGYETYLKNSAENMLTFFGTIPSGFDGQEVIEVGSGFFGVVSILKGAKFRVAFDPILSQYPEYIGYRGGVHYYCFKGEDIGGIEGKIFDSAFCINTINHVDDPKMVISNLHALLKPGGLMYIDVHIQRKSHIHPHSFSVESVRALVLSEFNIVKEFSGNTVDILGEGNTEVWGCLAQK